MDEVFVHLGLKCCGKNEILPSSCDELMESDTQGKPIRGDAVNVSWSDVNFRSLDNQFKALATTPPI
jgi:hypothetical protein